MDDIAHRQESQRGIGAHTGDHAGDSGWASCSSSTARLCCVTAASFAIGQLQIPDIRRNP
jgi:hypothetical protein